MYNNKTTPSQLKVSIPKETYLPARASKYSSHYSFFNLYSQNQPFFLLPDLHLLVCSKSFISSSFKNKPKEPCRLTQNTGFTQPYGSKRKRTI
jgi:hypothetical protein